MEEKVDKEIELPQEEKKGLVIFGRDVSKIPCFRNSFLYGISGGLTFGLAHFLFTSRTMRSINYSVYSCLMITGGYWVHCRYQYAVQKFEMMKLQEAIISKSLHDGTELQKEIEVGVEVAEV